MAVNRGYLKKRKNPKSDEVRWLLRYDQKISQSLQKINKQTNKHSPKHAKMTKNIFGIVYSFPVW